MSSAQPRAPGRFPRIIAVIGGITFLGFGLWAMLAPTSFFEQVATFDPYNQHFVQDIGAFQIGLGAVLIAAAVPAADGLAAGLLGAGTGAAAHTASHLVGQDLGGSPEVDIPAFAILTLLLVAGGVVRLRQSPSAR